MAKLVRSDSVTSRRIVQSFLDFLHSVEPAPGIDLEGLEVAKDCLAEVFKLDQLSATQHPEPNLLLNIFRSQGTTTELIVQGTQPGPSSLNHDAAMPNPQAADGVRGSDDSGVSKDGLFGRFFDALEKIQFFRTNPSGEDEHVLLDRATRLFHDAVNEIETSANNMLDQNSLADALKILGNKAMQSKSYSDAIERYTCAVALCENNAVYYCNRAAAYTQVHKYNEAIKDCLKAIEIDPNYSKAYSRMGLAYYAQGKYSDAINKGFRKALELDPNNDAVKENIRVAEQKLIEELEQRNRSQFGGGAGDRAGPTPLGSFPGNIASMFNNVAGNASFVDGNTVPAEILSMVENVARTFGGGQDSHENETSFPSASASESFEAGTIPSTFNLGGQGSQQSHVNGSTDEPGIEDRAANFTFNFNVGGQTPEQLNQAFSSMMGMFSGVSQPRNTDGRPDSR
ncbi:hypothetical protein KSS87_004579 [Heliosperma pusillum]|nr:hypothetical protein KSS87_004579 [Heliosperma pusillum]